MSIQGDPGPRLLETTERGLVLRGRPELAPFGYGRPDGFGERLDAAYAVVDVAATGLTPGGSDRIVEIAIVRIDTNGTVVDEWSTVLNPQRDPGPSFLHGIELRHLGGAPTFGHVAGDVLSHLADAVVVAYNAPLVEALLRVELERSGLTIPAMPALCALRLTTEVCGPLANPHPATAARALGVSIDPRCTRIGRAATTATIVRAAAARLLPLRYPARPLVGTPVPPSRLTLAGPTPSSDTAPTVRDISRLTIDSPDTPAGQSYVIAVLEMLRSKPTATAVGELARLAPQAGLDNLEIDRIHRSAIIGLWRQITLERRATEADAATITSLARHLGVPDVFDRLEIQLEVVAPELEPLPTVAETTASQRTVAAAAMNGASPVASSALVTATTPPAGWYHDPVGRHTYRWWDGATWSIKAASSGIMVDDPF
jgi:DNA polymerase-3 subunit epsilon